MTRKLGLSYAKCTVVHNTRENYMPLPDGVQVCTTDEDDIKIALGLDSIPDDSAIPAGLMKASNDVTVPIMYNGDFIIGPEGAHMNVSGISGLATKTSYIMFLLKALQYKIAKDVAIIIMNVKGDDLLHIHKPNKIITDEQRAEWEALGIPCEPFENVQYFYPYCNKNSNSYANSAIPNEDLKEQAKEKIAHNYVYTFRHDVNKLSMLFSNVDDPNWTIESILNYIDNGPDFTSITDWDNFKNVLRTFVNNSAATKQKEITVQSWRRFSRLINNSINDEIFQNEISENKERRQQHLSDAIVNIEGGQTYVVDIAGLNEQLQCLVFGDVIQSVYGLKHGDYEAERRKAKGSIPKKVIIFVDELNKYAPTTSSKSSPLLSNLLDITERGRSEGVILFSAEQFRSGVHERIKGNCSTNVYGRTNAIEVSRPDYKFVPNVYANMMTRLQKGDLIIHHPVFKTLLKVTFPFPSYHQGGSKR